MKEKTEQILKKLKSRSKYTTKELCNKGKKRYAEIRDKLEPKLNNKFVAIEVDSGDYFLGKDAIEANAKARKKYPDSVFFLVRIGKKSAFKIKREIELL